MASAALAAHTLGFDCTKAKLIVDPESVLLEYNFQL